MASCLGALCGLKGRDRLSTEVGSPLERGAMAIAREHGTFLYSPQLLSTCGNQETLVEEPPPARPGGPQDGGQARCSGLALADLIP